MTKAAWNQTGSTQRFIGRHGIRASGELAALRFVDGDPVHTGEVHTRQLRVHRRRIQENMHFPAGGGVQQIRKIGDLILRHQPVARLRMAQTVVYKWSIDRTVGAAVNENAVIRLRRELDDGPALRLVA